MVNISKTGYVSPFAVHPGETIKETLDLMGMTQKDLSIRSELSEKTISFIVNGEHSISPESALKFERVLGLSQKMLLQMNADYEADLFRLEEKEKVEKEARSLSQYSCYDELAKLGLVAKTLDELRRVEELLKFFGVNSLSAVRAVTNVSYRRKTKKQINYKSLSAWLRIGYLQAQSQDVADFDRDTLLKNIAKMRNLTKLSAETFSQTLVKLCAEAGVVLAYTPQLRKTYVNGSSRWLSSDKALIQVSLYYKRADIFWFTLFHELGHVLKHSKKETYIEFKNSIREDTSTEIEKEADLFAEQILIPPDREKEFRILKKNLNRLSYSEQIQAFADSINIDGGIVAGRIARETNDWRTMSRFRKFLQFSSEKVTAP